MEHRMCGLYVGVFLNCKFEYGKTLLKDNCWLQANILP